MNTYRPFVTKVKTYLYLSAALALLGKIVFLGIAVIAAKHLLIPVVPMAAPYLPYLFLVLLLFSVVFFMIAPTVRFRRYRYAIGDDKIERISGLWTIEHDVVPIKRLQKITLQSGPLQRRFGLATVSVITAGGTVQLLHLEQDEAEALAESLKNTINALITNEVSDAI